MDSINKRKVELTYEDSTKEMRDSKLTNQLLVERFN